MVDNDTQKKGKQVERYWTHPGDETIYIERDALNWIATVGVKTTYHSKKENALKHIFDLVFIKRLPSIPDEDKKSLVKMVEYEKAYYEELKKLFSGETL